jgi:Fic family protein
MEQIKSTELQIKMDDEFYSLLAETYGLIGKLDGICRFVPNMELYLRLLMLQEICASCELENVSVRFYDFFDNERVPKVSSLPSNLLSAMQYAQDCTFSESFIKNLHGILSTSKMLESEYRNAQATSSEYIFFLHGSNPVLANEISTAIYDMEKYISSTNYQNALISAARIQYQLEVLNPFNRYSRIIARLITMLMLKWGGLLNYPILCLSDYLLNAKIEYKDRIIATHKSGEDLFNIYWTKFFLMAVNHSAKKSIHFIESLANARQTHISVLPQIGNGNKSVQTIYEYVADSIIVNVRQISDTLRLSFSSVTKVIKNFEEAGIVRQVTQKERYRQFGYVPVLNLIEYI